jgi:uncharacterized membrane protein
MVVLAVGLFATIADVPMAWVVWPVGYGMVLPLAIGYTKRRQQRTAEAHESSAETDALARAKQRYVDGEIDEAEFEAAVEATLGAEEQ